MITKKNKLDARKRSEYDVERFSVCERLAAQARFISVRDR